MSYFSLINLYSINFQLGTNHKNKIIPHFTLFTQSFRFTKQTTHLNKDYLKEPSLPKTFTKPFLHINRHKTVDNHTITLTANIQPTIILSSYREFKPGQFHCRNYHFTTILQSISSCHVQGIQYHNQCKVMSLPEGLCSS